jgi:murein DD-endopeptidase MepM/ murein hydrolase activator NlpD
MDAIVKFIGLFKIRIFGVAVLVALLYYLRKLNFISPIAGTIKISSVYKAVRANGFHNGVDIPSPAGTAIIAPEKGTVLKVWFDNVYGGGNSLRIQHAKGYVTGYAHCKSIAVKVGDKVAKGQKIATVGSTGTESTGNHLHFKAELNGKDIDPSTIIKALKA